MNSVSAVKPSQLRTLLSHTIPAKMAVLICSGPGIGKSSIVEQACAEAEADCIVMHPVVSDPTDFKGMPWVGEGDATFLPFGDLQRLVTATKLTACFIDDLGQATPAVQAAAMQLTLARTLNGHRVSDQVVFIAATNRRTDRAGVSDKKAVFRDTLVTGLADLCTIMPGLNLTCDERLEELRKRAERMIANVDPQDLREVPSVRQSVARQAVEIQNMMASFMGETSSEAA